ncbi:MAG: membrane dipeptidase [Cyclobacteriaceae bacterium]|jgi:membrane dipeptidase
MKIATSIFSVIIVLTVFSCKSKKNEVKESAKVDVAEQAKDLAKKFIITDGHIDLPYHLKSMGFLDLKSTPDLVTGIEGNFDFPRAKEGGLDAPFMSIFIPAALQKTGGSKELADSLINMVENICTKFPDHFALVSSPNDVIKNFAAGKISLPMGMENGSPLEDDLENVAYFFDRGIRYITLTHGKVNLICDSSYDSERKWNGLSPFGREVVLEMNKQGIMVDVSHISDSTFYDVMELTDIPCIASHSSARKFTPGFERNMSDDMIKLLAKKNGVIQINFGSSFLTHTYGDKLSERDSLKRVYMTENNLTGKDSLTKAFHNKWMKENDPYADVDIVADHIDHVVKIAGIDYVGLGSDYDGVGNSLPTGLKDVAGLPNLLEELLRRGYSEDDIEKICSKNVFRVWNAVLDYAGKNN